MSGQASGSWCISLTSKGTGIWDQASEHFRHKKPQLQVDTKAQMSFSDWQILCILTLSNLGKGLSFYWDMTSRNFVLRIFSVPYISPLDWHNLYPFIILNDTCWYITFQWILGVLLADYWTQCGLGHLLSNNWY